MMADKQAPIRVVVADDEPLARRGVCQLLAGHRDLVVVAETRNGAETLEALRSLSPDLLFLDIQMPEMDGFDVLRAHGFERMPAVVFVTAYDQFAVRAFDAHALDYLVKPLNVERFEESLTRVRERLQLTRAADLANRLEALLVERDRHKTRGIDRLVVSTPGNEVVIPAAEIDWIESEDYYSRIHAGTKTYLLRESLTSLEAKLDRSQFVRVHRSAIVQIDRVRELRSTTHGHEAVLRSGAKVPVSRRKQSKLLDLIR